MRPDTIEHDRPAGKPVMQQNWNDLLFVHWAVDGNQLQAQLPPELTLDLYEGQAYLSLTPFRLSGLSVAGLPPLPYLSHFFECNLRTYVRGPAGPGIWFFSLDASKFLPALAARVVGIPYLHAAIDFTRCGDQFRYQLRRRWTQESANLQLHWTTGERLPDPEPGDLHWFLAERYLMYWKTWTDVLAWARVHHQPWPLFNTTIDTLQESVTRSAGFPHLGRPQAVAFSPGVHAEIWWPQVRVHEGEQPPWEEAAPCLEPAYCFSACG